MSRFYDHLDDAIKTTLLAQIRNLWTHHSTSLEGNSLTLGETDFILEEGLTIEGKPLKDHNEVYGHAKAIELIYALLNRCDQPITQTDLFQLHQTVLTERILDIDQPVGRWKNRANFTHYVNDDDQQMWREYPRPENIERLMAQWLDHLNQCLTKSNSRQQAATAYSVLHLNFVTIHRFFDGNGRMARLLANLPLLKSGFPPIVIPEQQRYHYKKHLSNYQSTITDLANLNDLKQLPNNRQLNDFTALCQSYWHETIELLEKANAIQAGSAT